MYSYIFYLYRFSRRKVRNNFLSLFSLWFMLRLLGVGYSNAICLYEYVLLPRILHYDHCTLAHSVLQSVAISATTENSDKRMSKIRAQTKRKPKKKKNEKQTNVTFAGRSKTFYTCLPAISVIWHVCLMLSCSSFHIFSICFQCSHIAKLFGHQWHTL